MAYLCIPIRKLILWPMSVAGTLYLIPNLLGGEDISLLPPANLEIIHSLPFFIVENAKNARKFLKICKHPLPMASIQIKEIDKHLAGNPGFYLIEITNGMSAGLLSDAGCPGIADPGADIVREAHRKAIKVKPLTGPSSILLTLMASGLNGQKFHFHGYLPVNKEERIKTIKSLEEKSKREGCTQVFIETPYRNTALLADLQNTLHRHTLLCLGIDLTLPTEEVWTKTAGEWKKCTLDIHKRYVVFAFLAG